MGNYNNGLFGESIKRLKMTISLRVISYSLQSRCDPFSCSMTQVTKYVLKHH